MGSSGLHEHPMHTARAASREGVDPRSGLPRGPARRRTHSRPTSRAGVQPAAVRPGRGGGGPFAHIRAGGCASRELRARRPLVARRPAPADGLTGSPFEASVPPLHQSPREAVQREDRRRERQQRHRRDEWKDEPR